MKTRVPPRCTRMSPGKFPNQPNALGKASQTSPTKTKTNPTVMSNLGTKVYSGWCGVSTTSGLRCW